MSGPRHMVGVGELRAIRGTGELVTLGLGSCIAIVLHDPVSRTGGMAHVLLPSPSLSRIQDAPGRYPETAVPALLNSMADLGAHRDRITARLIGGASMFASLSPRGSLQMGERNTVASREALAGHEILLVGELVGGEHGRSVTLDVESGRLEITSVARGVETL